MTYTFQNPPEATLKTYLSQAKTIAVVGLSDRPETAAYGVAKFLQAMDYQIIPVNPKLAGQTVLGQEVYACLQDVPLPIDIVDVFRRKEALPQVARDFIETDAKVFWAQLGLQSQEAEELLRASGRQDIVMNRCLKIDYRNIILNQD
ncbi:CoA-binding protein [Streptococcus pseudoporcinus]|uniref:CoA binding domain protein n=1 Tax=Streptococcus pseudoporcinus LQ 940-04 TaxID=875093 RepID=G5K787_9STRE|nr:CoA-binding protein [Streptococcus pseudoporcinus]EFR44941.1 CoA binding domain protein [Streptococcus pseudoporcinus SPIN 20026]EHI64531.1 CoA binding domain protein [Streptococcus pseudoporcinus LQ 940-04]VEF93968.1 CoA binding protein [Streptococcus pseudoporcinus]